MTEKQWDEILNEMIFHLERMDEGKVIEEISRNMPKDFVPKGEAVCEVMERHKNDFFKLFSEYFYDLWY
jgi:hypothetical protein